MQAPAADTPVDRATSFGPEPEPGALYSEVGRPQDEGLRVLESYVPTLARRHLVRQVAPLAEAEAHPFLAVILFADVTGFTSLTESLAAEDATAGAERVQEMLNSCFGPLVELVEKHGGEVVKFAGDATLAVWAVAKQEALPEGIAAAARCGLAIGEALETTKTGLRMRVGITCGEVWSLLVGGVADRWESLLLGRPLEEMGETMSRARPGEVVLSPLATEKAGDRCSAVELEEGSSRLRSVAPADGSWNPVPPVRLPQEALPALRSFVPRSILGRVEAEQGDWLAELRQTSVLFLQLEDMGDLARGADGLDRLQAIVRGVQEAVYRQEGSVLQLMADDKGCVLLAGWGVAGRSHKDDGARSVAAGLDLEGILHKLGVEGRVGIASGRLFAGSRGGRGRREYAVIGDVVNLAARLAGAASSGLLCDRVTRGEARSRFRFEGPERLTLKGKKGTIQAYRPVGVRKEARSSRAFFGRCRELEAFDEDLGRLGRGTGGAVVVEGKAGMGKSSLVGQLLERARARGLPSWIGAGDSYEAASPYFAWRPVFRRMGDAGAADGLDAGFLSLLNGVLGQSLEEGPAVKELSAEGRAEKTRELLIELFTAGTGQRPALVVLEDGHWMDSASFALAAALLRRRAPLLLILTTRPVEEPGAARQGLLEDPGTRHLPLAPLGDEAVADLVCERLGAETLTPAVARLVGERSDGNPFFAEELAYHLRETGLVRLDGGVCEAAVSPEHLEAASLPTTVQGLVTRRIDGLEPPEQLTLKVASVLGRSFGLELLTKVHPVPQQKGNLASELGRMERRDLVHRAGEGEYAFRHALTQDVAYGLLPFARRRRLHQGVAEALEEPLGDRSEAPPDLLPLLGQHWRAAGQGEIAMGYFSRAGDHALGNFANPEAIRFFSEALEVHREAVPEEVPEEEEERARRAGWCRRLGRASVNQSEYPKAQQHLKEALRLLGRPVPLGSARLAAGVLRQISWQLGHRLTGQRLGRVTRGAGAAGQALEAADALEGLAEIFFFTGQPAPYLYCAFAGLNLREKSGARAPTARGHVMVGNILGRFLPRRVGSSYIQQALRETAGTKDLSSRAWVLLGSGIFQAMGGEVAEARERFEELAALARRMGDRRRWMDATVNRSYLSYLAGELSTGESHALEVLSEAGRAGDARYRISALKARLYCLAPVDRSEDLEDCLGQLETLLRNGDETERTSSHFDLHVFRSVARSRAGDRQAARKNLEKALSLSQDLTRSIFYSSCIAAGWAGRQAVALGGEEGGGPPGLVQQALALLKTMTAAVPVAEPELRLLEGHVHQASGRPRRAQRAWARGLAAARATGQPYLEALNELAASGFGGDRARDRGGLAA